MLATQMRVPAKSIVRFSRLLQCNHGLDPATEDCTWTATQRSVAAERAAAERCGQPPGQPRVQGGRDALRTEADGLVTNVGLINGLGNNTAIATGTTCTVCSARPASIRPAL